MSNAIVWQVDKEGVLIHESLDGTLTMNLDDEMRACCEIHEGQSVKFVLERQDSQQRQRGVFSVYGGMDRLDGTLAHVFRRVWCREAPSHTLSETILADAYFDKPIQVMPGEFCCVRIEVVDPEPVWPNLSLQALQRSFPSRWSPMPDPDLHARYIKQVRTALLADPIITAAVEWVHSRPNPDAIPIGHFKPLVEAVLASGLRPASEDAISTNEGDALEDCVPRTELG